VVCSGFLRANIGRYAYIKDEASTLMYIKRGTNTFSKEFIFNTKRPPLQYQVAQALHMLGADLDNEFVMRLPYTLAGFFGTLVLFLYIHKLTANPLTAVAGALLYSVNGFIVGLGKIVQYQPFVMLFSALSLYLFYSYSKNRKLRALLLGVLSFSIGFYFHWDMIFVGPIILVYFLRGVKKSHILPFLLSISPLLFLYLIPYILSPGGSLTATYLSGRAGKAGDGTLQERLENYQYLINLYNPFLFLNFFIFTLIFSIFSVFKRPFEYSWLMMLLVIFVFFIGNSGTHMYTALMALFVCFSLALDWVLEKTKKVGYVVFGIPTLVLTAFFMYQSYMLFVDLNKEYPWQRETFFNGWKNIKYTFDNSSRYMIGFPSDRYFKEASVELRKMYPDYEEFTYDSNEIKRIASYYLELRKDKSDKMFLFAVKDPASFVNDARFKQYRNRKEILKLKNSDGRTMNKVYVWYKSTSGDKPDF